jgi:lipopolysaccharide export system protein LptA
MKWLFIIGFMAVASSWANPSAPSGKASPAASQFNMKILAKQMDCDQNQSKCVATGNATAEKLGDPKTKILKADQITVYFTKEGTPSPLKVSRLEAEGHVFLIIDDMVIQGKRGNYLAESEVAEVFEDVKITSGSNQLEGGYSKVNMKTGQYFIKQDGNQVQALIFTKETARKGREGAKGDS